MSINVALCCAPTFATKLSNAVKKDFGAMVKKFVCGSVPSDFAELKNSNEKFMIIVYGAPGRNVLIDLSDDYEKKIEDRRMQMIYSITAGVDVFDLVPIADRLAGIPFFNAQGCYANVLAEWVGFCMMYFNHSVYRLMKSKHESKWEPFTVRELVDMKVVIVGYGNIGQRTGRMARFFDMNVVGIKRTAKEGGEVDEFGVKVMSPAHLDEQIADADFVVGVMPGTPETKHMFNMELFKKMRRDAVYINVGRGVCQNDNDLYEALKNDVIRAAAVDVVEMEPLPSSSPLWTLSDEKLLISPHNADMTEDILTRSVTRAASLTKEFLQCGKVDTYMVNVHKGY